MDDTRDLPAVWWLEMVCTPIITVVGITGNILTLLVLARRSAPTDLPPASMRFFLMALTITDSLILLLPCFTSWIIYAISGLVVYNMSETSCRLGIFMVYFLLQLSPWILSFITIERVLVIVFPVYFFRNPFTLKRAILLFSFTVLLLTMLNAHLLFGMHLKSVNLIPINVTNESWPNITVQVICDSNEKHFVFMYKVWSWIDFAFAFGLPFLTLVIGNSLIIKTLISHESFRRTRSRRTEETGRRTSQSKQWTKVSVFLGLAFVILAMPIGVYQIGVPFWFPKQPDMATRNILKLIRAILHLLLYTNSAINFALYLLCGSSKLRKEFMKPIRKCVFTFCKCARNDIHKSLDMAETHDTLIQEPRTELQ
ncbi:chemerin-like receptor 2 [Mya arenaria]|uniref:chemerin-like receptor 2 n=1 Tax=Mya arenaria TaxID=6604 RepID=UPI0022E96A4D|nr:chemerin-like receptor 2 [Mya arenaria]XP_052811238.1 chemerin-like receptor 2 [Mya arenaria]XP_052811239.1 chemerin-like receptor 2 [Mya arenaria]